MKFTLYSKLASGTRNKKILSSNNFETLYNKAIEEINKDTFRKRDFFIVECGVKATKITSTTIL